MGNIASIKSAGVQPVYNMTVDKHHNYLIAGNIILKNCDAIRYGLIFRTMAAETEEVRPDEEDEGLEDYDDAMTGGEAAASYIGY